MRTCRLGRVAVVLLGVASLVRPGLAASEQEPPAAAPPLPPFLSGLDLEIPSQETFRGWPPRELVERPYWLPWGNRALARAALFNRPILLVLDADWSRAAADMMRGPFADPRVLAAINAGFVAIRVNADQRPDVRERYQTGSWPTIAFLLPDGRPMLSTTNDTGEDRPITTGAVDADTLLFLLQEGAHYWSLVPGELLRRGETWAAREGPTKPLLGVVGAPASDKMAQWMRVNADRSDGGYGAAPKFLIPTLLEYATLRAARGDPTLVDHARFTLERLATSPLYDGREGGLQRLAAAPGFGEIEPAKMLQTNAAFARELVLALRAGQSAPLHQALHDTARFLLHGLGREGGGFFLAQAEALDRTVLAGPNALAGAALVRAGILLGDPALESAGIGALDLVQAAAVPGHGVRHVLAPMPSTRLYLEALADSALGLLDAYESTGRHELLAAARGVVDDARRALRDPDSTALLDVPDEEGAPGLLANRRRPLRSNVRIARAMIRLDLHGEGGEYRQAALGILGYYCGDLSGFRIHGIEAALAIEEAIEEPLRIRISGPAGAAARGLRAAALGAPWPWTVVLTGPTDGPVTAELSWHGRSVRADTPAALAAAVVGLTSAGTSR